ncbi:MAG: hypothetical protein J6Y10_10440 [Lachnospiraceae bacterium]|nr:hypothetical protein [Lachnospiraceae bacterium]
MELIFIILSLACQIILLSHASDWQLGSQALLTVAGVTFSGRGLMILSVIFLGLAAFFGVLRISKSFADKDEAKKLKAENDMMKAENLKREKDSQRAESETPQGGK